ncbi:hypothetical protein LG634_04705 [Streptomyces bambusae]|uniref:hypothetical protein n=1 Tax=Streptomyces bambusae TaxID=1550616 RepID=UPI001CFD598A|nr:hypothetical protein [Streptomyces bambusae]MCB5164136.1 hypothetical protein [Streptomyces bambusae]
MAEERRKGCLIGCLVAGILGVLVLVAVGIGLFMVVDAADDTMIDRAVYESVKTGDAESAVRGRLPDGAGFIEDVLKEGGPARPAGTSCAWYLDEADSAAERVFRFCFKDGRLAEKAEYVAK